MTLLPSLPWPDHCLAQGFIVCGVSTYLCLCIYNGKLTLYWHVPCEKVCMVFTVKLPLKENVLPW